jgi:hypothetical protein
MYDLANVIEVVVGAIKDAYPKLNSAICVSGMLMKDTNRNKTLYFIIPYKSPIFITV